MKANHSAFDPAAVRARLFRVRKLDKHGRKDAGFSLIEIMAGMAIIAILALGILPQFQKYFERAAVQNMSSVVENSAMTAEADHSLTGKTNFIQTNVAASIAAVKKGTTTIAAPVIINATGAATTNTAVVGDAGFMLVGTDTEAPNFKVVYCSTGAAPGVKVVAAAVTPTCV